MKYYIENGEIKLVRYSVTYSETVDWNNGVRFTTTIQHLSTNKEYSNLIDMLKYRNVEYETDRIDTSKYSTLEFTKVSSKEEADELFKIIDESSVTIEESDKNE